MQFHQLSISNINRETPDTVSVAFTIPQELKSEFDFIPGQYVTLKTTIQGEDVRRAYSICSAPHEEELRVAIKKVENGVFSTYANEVLKEGDTIEVFHPNGHFYSEYDPSNEKNYVGFAAGSGITPVLSIIKHVLETEKDSKFTLFYGNKNAEGVIFGKQLDGLKNLFPSRFSFQLIYSRENLGNEIFYGRIDLDKLNIWKNGLFNVNNTDEFFMCGPEGMTHDIRSFLTEQNVPEEKVHFELFHASNETKQETKAKPEEQVHTNVKVIVDDEEYEFELDSDGPDILEAGFAAGIDLPFSCKGGVCSTCKAKVLEGEATMDLNYSILEEEVAQGYILTCQAHPKSEKLVVSFDE